MTDVTFPLRPPRLAFAICGRRWRNDEYENKVYIVCENVLFDLLQFNTRNILHLLWLKAWLPEVPSPVKNGNNRFRKGDS